MSLKISTLLRFFLECCRLYHRIPFPVCIKRRGRATIVEWADGTETKIIRSADEEDMGMYAVFCIALAKKVYGNNSALKKVIHLADEQTSIAAELKRAKMTKEAHAERMEKQSRRSKTRIARLARRKLKRESLTDLYIRCAKAKETNDEALNLVLGSSDIDGD